MITYGEAIVLGIIQGLTEFVPISSTAHLRIIPALLGWRDPGAAYSAVIQLGTLLALIIYFRKDLFEFAASGLRGLLSFAVGLLRALPGLTKQILRGEFSAPAELSGIFGRTLFVDRPARMVWYLVLGTVPISVFGLMFARYITGEARSLYVIAASLIALAVILWVVDRLGSRHRELDSATWKDFLLVGLAQSLALIPGSSRSGTTLTMGLLLGFTRESAMRISFLLSIPAIGLSGIYELIKEREELALAGFGGLFVGTLVSAVVGYLTIAGLLRYLRTHTTLVFVLYRIGLGLLIFFLLHRGSVH